MSVRIAADLIKIFRLKSKEEKIFWSTYNTK